MNKKLVIAALLISSFNFAQVNKNSLDFNFGFTKPVYPMTKGYTTGKVNLFHFDIGIRRMLNQEFGMKLDYGYDRFKNGKNAAASKQFVSYNNRFSIQGIVNIGRLMHFEEFAPKLSAFFHGGFGYSSLKYSASTWVDFTHTRSDRMIHGIIGITPQYKLTDRLALNFDVSIIPSLLQTHAWDFKSKAPADPGMDGNLANCTLGISYFFGPNQKSSDWEPTAEVDTSYLALERRVTALEKRLMDDDNDGVANLRDEEPGTESGALVNSKGQKLKPVVIPEVKDKDSDGMADEHDLCPDQKGPFSANGCPDGDGDGVPDNIDKCPNVAGERSNMGCPGATRDAGIITESLKNVEFDFGQATLKPSSYAALDGVVALLRQHPDYRLNVIGHTDDIGPDSYNVVLSIKRAEAVKKYLVGKGVSAAVLTATGLGETKPAVPNSNAQSRATNRRVVFEVKK